MVYWYNLIPKYFVPKTQKKKKKNNLQYDIDSLGVNWWWWLNDFWPNWVGFNFCGGLLQWVSLGSQW